MAYRSKRRDEPRLLHPVDYTPGDKPKPLPPGTINYSQDGPLLSEIIESGRRHNGRLVLAHFADESTALVTAIDNLYFRATEHLPLMYTFLDVQVNEALAVLVPCFHHSLLSLHVSHSLTAEGLYGPAHAHLRHAFEALIIAKFCSVNPAADVYDRWVDGVELYFTNSVLKKVVRPSLYETRVLWRLLCEKSHATIWSGQPDLHLESRLADVRFNFAIIGVLIRWASHLYSSHILTPSASYYGRR